MFGSGTPFGQPSSSPFGSASIFGSSSSTTNNPFAPKPFGSTTPFGAQTGSSLFGGTSTGMFGAPQTSSPFSTSAFGASSSPAFGSSTPAFGASSTPAFGSSSSPFGGSSAFGQKPAFGGFGSTTQTSPFGSTSQQSQPAFGSSLFGSSTPFGASSQPAFGASSTPAFGSTSTPAFGAASTPSFGATSTPAFGATSTPAFGSTGAAFGVSSTSMFGSGGAFGASSTPAFGASSTPAFGAISTPAFGAPSTPAFGAPSTPAFGASSTPAFGPSSTPSFSFTSNSTFGQSSSILGSSAFGTTTSPFGGQSSPFGASATTPTFGTSGFGSPAFGGGQRGGSRVVPYAETTETENNGQAAKLISISAMPAYKDKSHEELRWEDYQVGDKGGPSPAGQPTPGIAFPASSTLSNPFASTPAVAQSPANPFSTQTPSNPFAPKPSPFLSGSTPAFSSSFPSSNPFQSSPAFASTSAFQGNTSSSFLGTSTAPTFSSTPSLFSSTTAQASPSPFASTLNFASTSNLFQPTVPSLSQTASAFPQQQTSTPNLFSTPSTGLGAGLFSSTPSLFSATTASGFSQTTPSQLSQTSGAFSLNNFAQTQAGTSGFSNAPGMFGQNNPLQLSTMPNYVPMQPAPATNPFGTLPAMPQISITRAGTTPSVQYGISSMPVVNKPAPVRISSLLTSRHLLQRRIRLPARKYNPKHDGPKVPFFSEEEETPSTPKADALFIPRENPRALVIRPVDHWPSRNGSDKASPLKQASTHAHENGKSSEAATGDAQSNGFSAGAKDDVVEDHLTKDPVNNGKLSEKSNGVHEDHTIQKEESYVTLNGHRAGEAAIVYEHGADIEALMPKLRRSDYYTEPRIQELAAKERAEPGFCRRVKDFVVGRHGYGSIKFYGDTDVRRLDLESLVQFNSREVIVYLDDSKKPPVGQGLNKPAEVTLLNIKCFDKKTERQFTEGPKIEKYKEMLKRKAEDQGAEFVSYDPVKGEWKFRVSHFSKYNLGDEVEDDLDAAYPEES